MKKFQCHSCKEILSDFEIEISEGDAIAESKHIIFLSFKPDDKYYHERAIYYSAGMPGTIGCRSYTEVCGPVRPIEKELESALEEINKWEVCLGKKL
jgi:hypothetical protein